MKKVFLSVLVFLSTLVVAQNDKNNSKWAVGFGFNFIDNTNSQGNNYLNVSEWNSTYTFSKVSLQYFYNQKFSASSEFTINKLDNEKLQNGGYISDNLSYFGVDFNARYNTASYLKLPSKFCVEPVLGVGFSWTDRSPNQSLNTGLALGYQFNNVYALRLQTLGKFAAEKNVTGNNMIQHSLELLINL